MMQQETLQFLLLPAQNLMTPATKLLSTPNDTGIPAVSGFP
jgi:hypothetical protein